MPAWRGSVIMALITGAMLAVYMLDVGLFMIRGWWRDRRW